MRLTGHREYADEWAGESAHLDAQGVYRRLADLIPAGPVLEIGCGTGRGAAQLVRSNPVLSLDNNPFLLEMARRHVGDDAGFSTHRCDLLDLSATDVARITDFQPITIVAWFLGGSGSDVFRRTTEQPVPIEKGKLYREKIEDVVTSGAVLVPSVQRINLVNRGGRLPQFSDDEVEEATARDHDDHVFRRCGFEVSDVTVMDWPRSGSSFRYGAAANPNLAPGTPIRAIISISATRMEG